MKPVINYIACVMLCLPILCAGQNDTPLEILINNTNGNKRFVKENLFEIDNRQSDYLDIHLEKYTLLKLDKEVLKSVLKDKPELVNFPIPFLKTAEISLKVQSFSIQSEGFKAFEKSNGEIVEVEMPDAVHYRGIMERGENSQVGVSIFENEIYALFSNLEYGNIVLIKDPLKPGKYDQNYILYQEKDLKASISPTCGTDELKSLPNQNDFIDPQVFRSNVYESCEDVEVDIEATYKLYLEKSSTASTLNYISAFFNNVAAIYRNEGIYTSIARITVNTSEDGYTSLSGAFNKLNRFGDNVRNDFQSVGAELAHLVDYNSPGLGGIAWVNALCSNYFYFSNQNYHYGPYAYSSIGLTSNNFPNYSYTVFVFSHEMGHNLGSNHTQWCGWDGGALDNCHSTEAVNGQGCDQGPAPVNGGTIMSYCHNTSYGINFSEGFGEQPGNVIRNSVQSKTCIEEYLTEEILECTPSETLFANRECPDSDGWTHYYNDNNTSDESDDLLLISLKKGSNNIGNLDDGSLTVKLMTSSNAGNGSTHIFNPGYDANPDWHVMNRWFELEPTTEPQSPVLVRFYYTQEDFNDVMDNQPEILEQSDLTFYKIDQPGDPNPDYGHSSVSNDQIDYYTHDTDPSLENWTYRGMDNGYHIAEFYVNSFSGGGGGFSQNAPASFLPVELIYLEAFEKAGNAEIYWGTSSEIDNDFFTIERSVDGKHFEEIGNVKGKGYSSDIENYTFIDRNTPSGRVYYRLKQTDFNGEYEYVGTTSIEIERRTEIDVYPNPVTGDYINLRISGSIQSDVLVAINGFDGRKVLQKRYISSQLSADQEISLEGLIPGIYFMEILHDGKRHIAKLIKN